MNREYQKLNINDHLYQVLLILFAILMCVVSITETSFFTVLNVREIGILAFLFTDALMLAGMILNKEVSRKKRICHMIYACIATLVYMMYCKDVFLVTVPGTVDDALNTAGILCVLFVFISKE